MHNKIELYAQLINEDLYKYLDTYLEEYKVIFDSMRYSVENGGKRVRPLLTLLFCDACCGDVKKALPFADAVEYIHTYSLIHDDLPCMDNDDFRRGKPSNHKVYGEAFALLAGDGLLTAAFERITDLQKAGLYSADVAVKAIYTLSHLAGSRGMIGGQVIDLLNENNSNADFDNLKLMDSLKTGALIEAACVMGCIAAEADEDKINAATEFAQKIGLAFQIKDDILDVTSTLEKLGKMAGSDEQNGKSTYVTLLGVQECQKLVDKLTDEAMKALDAFQNNEALKEYAKYLADREN
ncbi:MAG: polyprenyl synthetase family protein [Clostridia bacterium]|nr:polyprenyl synthetase family protein [Clostridia bacterium]